MYLFDLKIIEQKTIRLNSRNLYFLKNLKK